MPPQSSSSSTALRRVQSPPGPVDLSSVGDLDVVSVLPTVAGWREWFGSTSPHLIDDPLLAKVAPYANAIGDLAKYVLARVRPGPAMTLTIASPLPKDGRSTAAANLALSCAALRKKVLLVDGDLHGRALAALFSIAVRPLGFSNVLAGKVYWRDLVSPHESYPDLHFLPAGSATLAGDLPATEVAAMLFDAKPFYDLILLDSAPLLYHPQTIDLVVATDASLLLARRSHTRQSELVSALGYLRRIEARVLAIALNDA